MWYKIALKGHKTYYDFNDLSYELKQVSDTDDSDWKPSGARMRTISYILKAYDLEHMDQDKPVGKMEFDLDFDISGKKQLELKLIRTDDYHEGMGVATNLYKWLKYNYENFDKPDGLVSNPFNPAAERLREKILGEPNRKSPMHKYDLDYTQGKLDI
jgi:hypothetical protein